MGHKHDLDGRPDIAHALHRLESEQAEKAILELRAAIYQNRQASNLKQIDDKGYHAILETVFRTVKTDIANLPRATKTKTSTISSRLSASASLLRTVVEAGLLKLRYRTVKAITEHVTQCIRTANGQYCEPLVANYFKALATVFGHKAHVEHFSSNEWQELVDHCLECIHDLTKVRAQTPARASWTQGDLSLRGSRANGTTPSSGQDISSQSVDTQTFAHPQLQSYNEDIVLCLRHLCVVSNAPILDRAKPILDVILTLLRYYPHLNKVLQSSYDILERVLSRTSTTDVALSLRTINALIPLIRKSWQKASYAQRESMLAVFLRVQFLFPHIFESSSAEDMDFHLAALLEVLQDQYCSRRAREQLSIDDIAFTGSAHVDHLGSCHVGPASIRIGAIRAEEPWCVLRLNARIYVILEGRTTRQSRGEGEERPRSDVKRHKKASPLEDLLSHVKGLQLNKRIYALQVTALIFDIYRVPHGMLLAYTEALVNQLSSDDPTIAFWTIFAILSLEAQSCANDAAIEGLWSQLWRLISRHITSSTTCKIACQALTTMLENGLVEYAGIADLADQMLRSTILNAPAECDAAATRLWSTLISFRRKESLITDFEISSSVLGWLYRCWSPSNYVDRTHMTYVARNLSIVSLLQLICLCLGIKSPVHPESPFTYRGRLSQVQASASKDFQLCQYLMGKSADTLNYSRLQTNAYMPSSAEALVTSNYKAAIESFLGFLVQECSTLHNAINNSSSTFSQNVGGDVVHVLVQLCIIGYGILRSSRLDNATYHSSARLLDDIRQDLALMLRNHEKRPELTVSFFDCVGPLINTMSTVANADDPLSIGLFELSQSLDQPFWDAARSENIALDSTDRDPDSMEIDVDFEPQASQHAEINYNLNAMHDEIETTTSIRAFQASIMAKFSWLSSVRATDSMENSRSMPAAHSMIRYLTSLTKEEFILCKPAINDLFRSDVLLSEDDADTLLQYLQQVILRPYEFENSEAAFLVCTDAMAAFSNMWTNGGNGDIAATGAELYIWFTNKVQSSTGLSRVALLNTARLLHQIMKISLNYASVLSLPSARTTLLQVLREGDIAVKYAIGDHIAEIFGLFVLERHAAILEDIIDTLPTDPEWKEGIAIRIQILGNLAAAWPTLLRRCIYAIFETAARVEASQKHASITLRQLSIKLKLSNCQELFRLFAPQLIYTWLESQSIRSIPYKIYGYASIEGMVSNVQDEIIAQVMMRGKSDEFGFLEEHLEQPLDKLIESSFGKVAAYSMARDVTMPPSNDSKKPEAEPRIKKLLGREKYTSLVTYHFANILATFFLRVDQEDQISKAFARFPAYSYADVIYRQILSISHSKESLPPTQQPSFRAKFFLDELEPLCSRTPFQFNAIWSQGLFIHVFRRVIDTAHPAFGSLHFCSVLKKLRMLICMAGPVALEGYPLQMALHALRPFLTSAHSTDDCVGLLQYLLEQGKTHLQEVPSFLLGHGVSTLIDLKDFLQSSQDSTTQEDSFKATISKAHSYTRWLISYLSSYQSKHMSSHAVAKFQTLVRAASNIKNNANAKPDTHESDLLLVFLDDQRCEQHLLSKSCQTAILQFLGQDFEKPTNFRSDILGDDEQAARFSHAVLSTCRSNNVQASYLQWAARVLGRSYASHGLSGIGLIREFDLHSAQPEPSGAGIAKLSFSRISILNLLSGLLTRASHPEVGLAESALRSIVTSSHLTEYAPECEKSLDPFVYRAMLCLEYEFPNAKISDPMDEATQPLDADLVPTKESCADLWTRAVSRALANIETDDPLLITLRPILAEVDGFAKEAFPFVLHSVLLCETDGAGSVKTMISGICRQTFARCSDPGVNPEIVKLLLTAILYLRSQPLPRELAKSDRVRWLDLDFRQAAVAAIQCSMFKTALLMLEIEQSELAKADALTRRRSTDPQIARDFPSSLLLSVYQHLDEKDAFYGIKQPPTLASISSQLEYEQPGFKSLSFQSAFYDCQIRQSNSYIHPHKGRMVQMLNSMSLSGLSQSLSTVSTETYPEIMDAAFNSARKLELWDLSPPLPCNSDVGTIFTIFRRINNAKERWQIADALDAGFLECFRRLLHANPSGKLIKGTLAALAVLTETEELFTSQRSKQLEEVMEKFSRRDKLLETHRYDRAKDMHSCRETAFGTLNKRPKLRELLKTTKREAHLMECQVVLTSTATSHDNGALQDALASATYLTHLAEAGKEIGIHVQAASDLQNARVLWSQGEKNASIRLMSELNSRMSKSIVPTQDLQVGRPGLLAKLGNHTADARLEKPDYIIDNLLREAIKELRGATSGDEAAEVFHEFASFCDHQLQNADSLADFERIRKLRERKEAEVKDLDRMIKSAGPSKDRENLKGYRNKAKQWFDLDDKEYQRLQASRETLVNHSLENYLQSLRASDKYENDALRFSTMWLENHDNESANKVVSRYLPHVPSRSFALLMNQWTSRLLDIRSRFQGLLFDIILRICIDHPYHGMYQIFASSKTKGGKDEAALSRHAAANTIVEELKNSAQAQRTWLAVHNTNVTFVRFAQERLDNLSVKPGSKILLRKSQTGLRVEQDVLKTRIPPPTMAVKLRADCDYSNVTTIARFQPEFSVATGISMPKIATAIGTDGKKYKQLYKSGNDDLRQDAIMEQVFSAVSSLLQTQRATRQRNLQIRTYKVLPLTSTAGVIEFVPNTIPLHDYLLPAHQRHYPKDLKPNACRKHIQDAQSASKEHRVKQFQKVCEQFHPVLRYFFQERLDSPDDWYDQRLAYTRSTAAISILGHLLGLGDRHGHNILLDEGTGEVVHIDLGIAFEQGRVLPVPEVVPFRLTRDLVDGMGVTGTEGVFRRCCEFTLEALRNESYAIMSILDVLRYDPLYSWSLSPLRLKKMQDAQTEDPALPVEGGGLGKKVEEEGGEAERALMVVSKKLSPTLSVQATVNELIQQATDERNLAVLFCGWAAYA